ncbi:hypothetical protein AGMMS49975_15880 [Clostridia bacterium]|nr:hypothetical protein AGMMS49975_15880 [Clostridia bacterium]
MIVLGINRLTTRYFDSDSYNESEIIRNISYIIEKRHGAKDFFSAIRHTLNRAFGVEQSDVIILGKNTAAHTSTSLESQLPHLLQGQKATAVYYEDAQSKTVRTALIAHNIEVVIPIISAIDRKTLGAIVLSPRKRKFDRYYGETLERIAAIISPFVQSAILYEEVLDLNHNMADKIRKQTRELRASNKELLKLDDMKSELLTIVSHNLRTPLTGVIGYADMMLEGGVSKKELEMYAGEIKKSGKIMNQVVNSLLDASRIDSGRFGLNKTVFSLTDSADQEVAAIRWLAEDKGIELTYSRDKGDIEINGDISRIRQVVANLLDNAIFYGKSKVDASLRKVGSRAVFTVKDDGIGIPKADQAKIFGKMFRASNAEQHRPDGTGIGLYVSKTVIENHGGKLTFSSIEGEGSAFTFELDVYNG